jgi:phage head maturation protease
MSRELLTREIHFQARAVDKETREVTFTAATEGLVDVGYGAPEVLRMSGLTVDKSRGVPFLNAHRRMSVTDTLGRSTKGGITVDGRELVVRVRFSRATPEANAAWGLVEDGTLDAVSVGYSVAEFRELRAGEFDGRGDARVEGPAIVVTKWTLRELSLVPIGADPSARKRALAEAKREDVVKIKPEAGETREKFTARALADAGLVAEHADETKRRAAIDALWLEANPPKPPELKVEPKPEPAPAPKKPEPTRSLDAEQAQELEDRKRLILSRCPKDLVGFVDDLLLDEPMIAPEAAFAKLREERARRIGRGGGTPEPKAPGKTSPAPTPTPSPNKPADEGNDLARLVREVR